MIYCPQCGTPNADSASTCGNCQAALPQAGGAQMAPAPGVPPAAGAVQPGLPQSPISNYLLPAIGVTLCCCLPGGIVAIVYAAQVNQKLQAGDIAGAQAASNNAKLWCMISAGVGLLQWFGIVGWFIANVAGGF